MEQSNSKSINENVFKRLETTNKTKSLKKEAKIL